MNLKNYSRRPCLEFLGIPYTKDESTDELIIELAQKIGVYICNSDINISHPLAQPTNSKPTLIQIQVLLSIPGFGLEYFWILEIPGFGLEYLDFGLENTFRNTWIWIWIRNTWIWIRIPGFGLEIQIQVLLEC